MDYKISILFLIIFSLKEVTNSDFTQNYFDFILINDTMNTGTYISPTISEDGYLYIVTGHDEDFDNDQSERYYVIYDIKTSSLIEKRLYYTSQGFSNGEAYAFIDKYQYFFISTYSKATGVSTYEAKKIRENKKEWIDNSIYGYRRSFKKADSVFYFMHPDRDLYLNVKKMTITYYIDNIPYFETIKTNKDIKLKSNEMISCDLTKDYNYILCAYFSEEQKASVSVFERDLTLKLTESFGKNDNYDENNFIKILYFKYNSVFVMMNSQSDKIARLSYFYYENNKINDKLAKILQNSNNYLDIENTQYKGNYGDNDIIALDTDKIIKIFGNNLSNNIIITIIQFYENDSSMSIKIYNMINNNNFDRFYQSRISLLKNSIVFCASAFKYGQLRTGYSIINYPNSKDKYLTSDRIIISNLISLENKLFSIEPKFKILNIPNDLILISKLTSKKIVLNAEYDYNDELILEKYRINEGPYNLEYQSIARGTDLGYSHLKVYPPDKVLNNNELLFEGRYGKITIDFQKCLDGYYNLESDINLCSNVKPSGHYLDEKEKIYKKCPEFCKECEAPEGNNDNCLSCKDGYILTDDTKACYPREIDYYYYDINERELKRCHPNCLRCYGAQIDEIDMNCVTCPKDYYKTIDVDSCYDHIPNNYYLDKEKNILKRCFENCLNCLGPKNEESMNCLGCINDEYFYRKDINNCSKPEDFKKRENISLNKINNDNFYIFICILIASLFIFIIICACYKTKEELEEKKKDKKKKEKKEKKDKNALKKINEPEQKDEKMVEMIIKNDIDNNNNEQEE